MAPDANSAVDSRNDTRPSSRPLAMDQALSVVGAYRTSAIG